MKDALTIVTTFRRFLTWAEVGQFAATVGTVAAVLGPLGFAMSPIGLSWSLGGAGLWTALFWYAAARTGHSRIAWGLAGGLICGAVWAFGEVVGNWFVLANLGPWRLLIVLAFFAGLGGGALIGATLGRGESPQEEKYLRRTSIAIGSGLGLAGGIFSPYVHSKGGFWVYLAAPAVGWFVALLMSRPGRALGLWFRPAVLFFDELWPYLREMTVPLGAFAVGYLTLTVAFAGFFGALWRYDHTSLSDLPPAPDFWDFLYFSLMTASTANTKVIAVSKTAQALVAAEVILGLGWLIVVFGALSAHLAPRLERIAETIHRHPRPAGVVSDGPTQPAGPSTPLLPPQTQGPSS